MILCIMGAAILLIRHFVVIDRNLIQKLMLDC
jgi:hypothetical protein